MACSIFLDDRGVLMLGLAKYIAFVQIIFPQRSHIRKFFLKRAVELQPSNSIKDHPINKAHALSICARFHWRRSHICLWSQLGMGDIAKKIFIFMYLFSEMDSLFFFFFNHRNPNVSFFTTKQSV